MTQYPVVGIGGSAGGLEAFERLFRALAPDTGAAFVVIQHLKADHPSQLNEILGRCTAMPVATATQGVALQPDHVYVATPGRELELADGQLRLVDAPTPHHPPAAIDRFFRSLAKARGPRAIGVVFSGMGDDGTLGLKAIKQAGGVVLVQDPATAAFDAMPRSAAATHMADHVLDVEGIAEALQSYILRYDPADAEYDGEDLDPVLDLLRHNKNHDFRGYKRPMLSRRIRRRLHLAGLDSLEDYQNLLAEKPDELEHLHRDLLISVTDFFRDPEAYTALQSQALPRLPALVDGHQPVRAWVPACATGEEAYSIAVLLSEAARTRDGDGRFHVFASDIDAKALDIARVGIYPENISADVAPEYMRRYFAKTDHHYQITNDLRQNIVFAAQDLLRDPPYSRLDLISCRNLLIYLSPDVQKYVLTLFHFALREGGFLFLGNAETIGQADDLFEPVDARHRIYQRIAGAAREQRHFPFVRRGEKDRSAPSAAAPRAARANDADQIAQQLLLRDYVPACVLINRKAEVLCAYGPTQRYLALPIGAFKQDLMDMADDDLRHKLRAGIHQAIRDNSRQQVSALRDDTDDAGTRSVQISVRPLHRPPSARGLLLVTFEDLPAPVGALTAPGDEDTAENRFAEELRATQDELQSTIQSLEAANEDLQGSNEEIMSMNEEFQSTNEELETSKEELQSLNEELSTVNNELRGKLTELEHLNNDLANLFSGTRVATLFLDRELRVMRFTPAARDLLYLMSSDIGRPLRDIKLKFDDADLLDDVATVLDELTHSEAEVPGEQGRWYVRRILPYRTQDDVIDGVVISFSDITELRAARAKAEYNAQQLRHLADALPALVAHFDNELRYVLAGAGHEEWFGVDIANLPGRPLASLLGGEHYGRIVQYFRRALAGERVVYHDQLEHPELGPRSLHVLLAPNLNSNGEVQGVYLLASDITDVEHRADADHANRVASMSELAATVAHQLNQPLGAISSYAGALRRRLGPGADDETRDITQKIAVQARAASDILNELREFIGRRTLDRDAVNINSLVRRVVILTEGRTLTVGATVKLELAPNLPTIEGSPVQLEQLVVNLVVNALEAMRTADTRRLEISTEVRGEILQLCVRDTGPGVVDDELDNIWDAFYTTKEHGMGMGLAICRGVAEEHGGRISVEPADSGGAAFYVRLPVGGGVKR